MQASGLLQFVDHAPDLAIGESEFGVISTARESIAKFATMFLTGMVRILQMHPAEKGCPASGV